MTKARTLADFNTTGVLTSTSNLDASKLTSGTIPNDRYGTPTFSGANLTSLNSANLSGALPALDGSSLTGIDSGTHVETGRVLLSSNTFFITLDNCFTSEYENYLMILSDVNSTIDGRNLCLRLRTGGSSGSTDMSAQYRYASRYFDDDGHLASNTGVDHNYYNLMDDSEEDSDWKGYNGTFTVYQPQQNTSTRISGIGSFTRNDKRDVAASYTAMHYDTAVQHTGIQLHFSAGDIRAGASVTVYGIKTS